MELRGSWRCLPQPYIYREGFKCLILQIQKQVPSSEVVINYRLCMAGLKYIRSDILFNISPQLFLIKSIMWGFWVLFFFFCFLLLLLKIDHFFHIRARMTWNSCFWHTATSSPEHFHCSPAQLSHSWFQENINMKSLYSVEPQLWENGKTLNSEVKRDFRVSEAAQVRPEFECWVQFWTLIARRILRYWITPSWQEGSCNISVVPTELYVSEHT